MRFPPAEPACRVCRGKRASRADVHQRRGSAWCAGEGQPLGDERGLITCKAAQRAGSGHRPGRSAAERAAHFGRRPGGRWPAPARCRAWWTAKTGDLLRGIVPARIYGEAAQRGAAGQASAQSCRESTSPRPPWRPLVSRPEVRAWWTAQAGNLAQNEAGADFRAGTKKGRKTRP